MKVVSSKVIIVLEADEVVVRESKGLLYLVIKSSLHPMALEYLGPFSVGVIWKPFCSLLPYKDSLLHYHTSVEKWMHPNNLNYCFICQLGLKMLTGEKGAIDHPPFPYPHPPLLNTPIYLFANTGARA